MASVYDKPRDVTSRSHSAECAALCAITPVRRTSRNPNGERANRKTQASRFAFNPRPKSALVNPHRALFRVREARTRAHLAPPCRQIGAVAPAGPPVCVTHDRSEKIDRIRGREVGAFAPVAQEDDREDRAEPR